MQIALHIDGNNQTYTVPFISARMLRNTLDLVDRVDAVNPTTKEVDQIVDYMVELFGNKFTRDQYYDGLEASQLLPTFLACSTKILLQMNQKAGALSDPNV